MTAARAVTSFVVMLLAAVVAGAVGGGVSAVFVSRTADAPGQLVHLGPELGYVDGVYCIELHHFCIPDPEPGEPMTAFYSFTTHAVFREHGCPVTWRPGNGHAELLGPDANGAFREGCGGAIFDRRGHRVFGPAPRDLDRFPITTTEYGFTVDTRTLICGAPAKSCERAPRID